MKNYELWLYGKQGNDLNAYMEQTKTIEEAFHTWAEILGQHQATCKTVAEALEGKNVTIDADGLFIHVYPKDKEADKVCKALVDLKILSVFPPEEE